MSVSSLLNPSARRLRWPTALVSVGAAAVLLSATAAPTSGLARQAPDSDLPGERAHRVILKGLDNPRQLSHTPNGDLLIAQAGHGSYNPENCMGSGQNQQCVGRTGKVTVLRDGKVFHPIRGLFSIAGPDGSFASGSAGASKRPDGGPFYAAITDVPPGVTVPSGPPFNQLGKLIAKRPLGVRHPVADIGKFEATHDPDGEGVESNPYAVLALDKQVLVADAAGDYIARVQDRKVSVWAVLPEYGPRVDAVPTSISAGPRGKIYVGELHSEQRGKARVWKYDRDGTRLRDWKGFTTVHGVDRAPDGTLYVSELFGGPCGFDDIPECFPGRVVKVRPDGSRDYIRVPFPGGVTVAGDKIHVVAFSISPAKGFGGNPDWSGQLWRIFF